MLCRRRDGVGPIFALDENYGVREMIEASGRTHATREAEPVHPGIR
jgi:hypothetical protein